MGGMYLGVIGVRVGPESHDPVVVEVRHLESVSVFFIDYIYIYTYIYIYIYVCIYIYIHNESVQKATIPS